VEVDMLPNTSKYPLDQNNLITRYLDDIGQPDIYRKNPFQILQLPVTADGQETIARYHEVQTFLHF
jgi:hypothetical protein